MSKRLVDEIKKRMTERSTADLLAIWTENNLDEWSSYAFEAIRQILLQRDVDIPEQDPPPDVKRQIAIEESLKKPPESDESSSNPPKPKNKFSVVVALGNILNAFGYFSLVMTGLHLWRVGFPRLEGPEGESWPKVLSISASYVIMGLISFGFLGLGNYLTSRFGKKDAEPINESQEDSQSQ